MPEDGTDDMEQQERDGSEVEAERLRAERVARVVAAVRSGTYQVRSEVVANRIIDSMLRRPKKG